MRILLFVVSFFYLSIGYAKPIVRISEIIELEGLFKEKRLMLVLNIDEANYVSGIYKIDMINTIGKLDGKIINRIVTLNNNEQTDNRINTLIFDIHEQSYIGKGFRDGVEFLLNLESKCIPYKKLVSDIKLSIVEGNDYELIMNVKGNEQKIRFSSWEEEISIIFEDLNFDGYPDIRISNNYGNLNTSYDYFLFDPKSNIYQYSQLLSENIINPRVLYEKKVLIGQLRDGCCFYKKSAIKGDDFYKFEFDYIKEVGKMISIDIQNKTLQESVINQYEFENSALVNFEDDDL